MTDDLADAARDLLARAEALPYGLARVAVHEEAITLADRHGDDLLACQMRYESLLPLYLGKRSDLLMVHFAWCAAFLDARPDIDPGGFLFTYRWVIDAMPKFETIPLATINRTWEEMRTRYERAGLSLRPVWVLRRRLGSSLGDRMMAAEAHRRYKKCRRDHTTDDSETETAFDVYYHADWDDDTAVRKAAMPFLNGTFTRVDHQIGVLSRIMLPLTRAGRLAEALAMADRVTRWVAARPHKLGCVDSLLKFLAVAADSPVAVRAVERHFAPSLAHPGRLDSFTTLIATKLLTARLLRAGRTRLSLRVGDGIVPGHGPRVPVAALDEWLTAEAAEVARLADARNGNAHYTGLVAELDAYHSLADRVQATAKDSHE